MRKIHAFRILASLSVTALAMSLNACGAPNPASSAGQIQSLAVRVPASSHLYVTDPGAGALFRFPLDSKGIPAGSPDAALKFADPRGVTIAPDGKLYVVDTAARTLSIFNPVPGSRSKPIRVLNIGHKYGLDSVGVDADENVWVNYSKVCTSEGFSCGFSDVYSPLEKGLHYLKTLNFGGGAGGSVLRSMSFDPSDRLVEVLGAQGGTVWTDSMSQGGVYPLFCGAEDNSATTWGPGNSLYEADLGSGQADHPPQIAVVPDYTKGRINNCPTFYTISSSTTPITAPHGIATKGTYIYLANFELGKIGSGSVFVFNPAIQGQQRPIDVLRGANSELDRPWNLAVGP